VLESRGVPTLAIASDEFAALARQVSADLSFPDARIVVVAHPIGGEPDEVLHRRAEGAIDELIREMDEPSA
jgi:hypothetical protein